MKTQDKARFGKALAACAQVFDQEPTKERTTLYFEALIDLDIEEVEKACFKAIQQLKWFPKPAEIRNLVLGDPETRAMLAWDTTLKAVRQHGYYDSVNFTDPLITAVIHDMAGSEGWPGFSEKINDNTRPFIAKEFQTRYRAHLLNPPKDIPPHLPGQFEIDNRVNGFPEFIPKAVEIGEKLKPMLAEKLAEVKGLCL